MNTNWEFGLGQVVYLRTDKDQLQRIVTERKEQLGGSTLYGLSTDLTFSWHYGLEISEEYDECQVLNLTK